MKFMKTLILTAIILAVTGASAFSMELRNIEYPDITAINETELILNGLGTREATIFNVDVYVAALYLETPRRDGYAICEAEELKRLILHFVRDVSAGDIAEAWAEGFVKNGGDDLTVYEDRIEILNSWMCEMKDGDRMMFTYIPGTGLEVSVKGSVMGTIEGVDFTGVFFSIWLGDDPPNDGLRDGLLGID